jgi:hypothetical protein
MSISVGSDPSLIESEVVIVREGCPVISDSSSNGALMKCKRPLIMLGHRSVSKNLDLPWGLIISVECRLWDPPLAKGLVSLRDGSQHKSSF